MNEGRLLPRSNLLQSHIDDLVRWGVVIPLKRSDSAILSPAFLTPKSNGVQSRALYDGRKQNALINYCALQRHGRFSLRRPYHQILIGTAAFLSEPRLAEVDFTSYFFEFAWAPALGRAHAFRVGGRRYAHAVGVQGSALMPLVAQGTSAVIAEAPHLDADPWEHVAATVNITYDNILIAAEKDAIDARWARLLARARTAGVVIGDTQPPTTRLLSCGIEFDVGDVDRRRWRLAPTWAAQASTWMRATADASPRPSLQTRQTLAGFASWALRVMLAPLWRIRRILVGEDDPDTARRLATVVAANQWRTLRAAPSRLCPTDAAVAVADGSIHGIGFVVDGVAHAQPWPQTRLASEQQEHEWAAAAAAICLAASTVPPQQPILLVADNVGILAALLSGNPRSQAGRDAVAAIEAALKGPLWLAYCPSADNPADAPSRAAVAGTSPVPWPHPLAERWRAAAKLAEWTMAAPLTGWQATDVAEEEEEKLGGPAD